MNLRYEILQGLARNTAASADVLLRLLHPEAKAAWRWLCTRRGLPPVVVAALVTHPDWRVRGEFAQSPGAAPADRTRLVDDPESRVREALAYGPEPHWGPAEPLADATYRRLLADPEPGVREDAARSWSVPDRVLADQTAHPDAAVRREVCRVWDVLEPAAREALLADPDPAVRRAATRQACRTDARLTDDVLAAAKGFERGEVLAEARLSHAIGERLMDLDDPYERRALARNASLPPPLVARLAADPEHDVRLQVSARPELTEEQRAAIDHEVARTDRLRPLAWVLALDADALRPVATSAHRWLRRSAAVHPELPADLVERLAQDEDFGVRLMICERQPDAPAEVLLRTVLEWDGYSSHTMLRLPQFPRKGLARYADDPSPALRRLAVFDPDASPELIERLSRDESVWVQKFAAADERLPRTRIEELLGEVSLAQQAATNPALTDADTHRLLDELGVPD
ncbi:hypothetical protein ACWD4G_09665 [Streptomyces sp. NPDC002643]